MDNPGDKCPAQDEASGPTATPSPAQERPARHRPEASVTEPINYDLVSVLYQAFMKCYHEDLSNAAMHCAPVRYSPLTFRLAEQIHERRPVNNVIMPNVYAVILDKGSYEEDPGR